MQPVVGIDVGKEKCHLCIATEPIERKPALTEQSLDRDQVATTVITLAPAGAIVALELTGNLALPIILALEGSHQVLIAQHTDTAALRQLLRIRRKTDKLDAKLICRLACLTLSPETAPLTAAHLVPWPQLRAAIMQRAAVRHLQALVRDQVRATNRLKVATRPEQADDLTASLLHLQGQISAAEKAITKAPSPTAQLLDTIPGVSPRLAAVIDAAVGDATRFHTADQLVAYLGLTPPYKPQSGQLEGKPKVRRGLTLLRSDLHMYGLRVAAHPESHAAPGRTYLRVAQRLDGTAGMWAAKRQLIRITWAILTSGRPYEERT